MPPKPKITREQIVGGAFALVRKRGADALTAKALAEELSCSTQPIFWHFSGMEEIKREVYEEALCVFGKALRRKEEGASAYLSAGLNYVRFAAEEPHLFRMLFMSDCGQRDIVDSQPEMDYLLRVIAESEHITGEDAQTVYRDMWLFSHGIAAMIATGTASFSREQVRGMLSDVCRGLILVLEKKKIKEE